MTDTSGAENHGSVEKMSGYTITNDMLSLNFSSSIAQDGTVPSLPGTLFESNSTSTPEKLAVDFQSIVAIFQSGDEPLDENSGSEDGEDEPKPVDYDEQNRRTERLQSINPALNRLWSSGSDYMTGAAKSLADGSRDPRWRIPIGKSGILNTFLAIMATDGVPNQLMNHVLRLIGNSSADTDENRERVIAQGYLQSIARLLKNAELLPLVIPVLYNLCVDYEPAQNKASEAQLTKELIDFVSSPLLTDRGTLLGYVCKILELLVTQPSEAELAPENVPEVLFDLAIDPQWGADVDYFLALTSCSIAYLRYERFQKVVIKSSAVQKCSKIMIYSYTTLEAITNGTDPSVDTNAGRKDIAQRLSAMRSNLNQVLSDISALPEFAATFPILSPFASSLRRSLSSPQIQLQVMACIMLGNIARSDKACEEFVSKSQIHKPLINIVTEAQDQQLLHAALGFLKNLALPLVNKPALGEAGLLSALPRLWNMETLPQIQYSSISLTRHLLNKTFENVQRICYPLSDDQDSPAYQRTPLSTLTSIYQRTDAEPIKVEIARLLTAICRVLTSPSQKNPDIEEQRKQFFQYHPEIARPLSFMISQTKWPAVRSEGWFVMALMARTPEGANIIAEMIHDVQVFQPLVELLTGKSIIDDEILPQPPGDNARGDHPNEPPNSNPSSIEAMTPKDSVQNSRASNAKDVQMSSFDRENALVLVSELLRNRGDEMAAIRRSLFEDLLKGGGLVHLSSQQVREREEFFDGGRIQTSGLESTGDGEVVEESMAG